MEWGVNLDERAGYEMGCRCCYCYYGGILLGDGEEREAE